MHEIDKYICLLVYYSVLFLFLSVTILYFNLFPQSLYFEKSTNYSIVLSKFYLLGHCTLKILLNCWLWYCTRIKVISLHIILLIRTHFSSYFSKVTKVLAIHHTQQFLIPYHCRISYLSIISADEEKVPFTNDIEVCFHHFKAKNKYIKIKGIKIWHRQQPYIYL